MKNQAVMEKTYIWILKEFKGSLNSNFQRRKNSNLIVTFLWKKCWHSINQSRQLLFLNFYSVQRKLKFQLLKSEKNSNWTIAMTGPSEIQRISKRDFVLFLSRKFVIEYVNSPLKLMHCKWTNYRLDSLTRLCVAVHGESSFELFNWKPP